MLDHILSQDTDPQETTEWLESLDAVAEFEGDQRVAHLMGSLLERARDIGAPIPFTANTPYLNTIPTSAEPAYPGDLAMEWRIRTINRWNAMVTVLKANKVSSEYGGHIASFASSAVLYDVGLNHFWKGATDDQPGDLVYIQGHSAPGFYARAFMEGRITEDQLKNFRRETGGEGLSSYPHPWLMPDFWQFPTVSMGLGPHMAIYQARFLKYLHNRGICDTAGRKVWAFMGDGEMDEPESQGAISLAAREGLDNLVFVINCNLQRLDGPVRGNGKIIQELEGNFRGAGWDVLKVIWGSGWDSLLQRDTSGILRKRMEECIDGEYQSFKSKGGAYTRENFFGKYPELKAMVADMTDEDIWRLSRGGHDPLKVHAAYDIASKQVGKPTLILAKTVKGYGMGEAGEGLNITHQQKKMGDAAVRAFRDRFDIPVSDKDLDKLPFLKLDKKQHDYMMGCRDRLGGFIPSRRQIAEPLDIPDISAFDAQIKSSGDREISTTMAFVRILTTLVRDKKVGKRMVPIVPDESRTFGMEGMFRSLGIYNPEGQLYTPEDADQLMYYKEDKKGQVLQEGINECGAMSSWIAAATSYSSNGTAMIPVYIYYSMFGFQRIGDSAWAAGDMRARGFMVGGTAGRTTLNGEGLQHEDGHSHIFAGVIPNCITYDPTFSYEVAVIVHDGLRRMMKEQEDVFYYLTVMNENYTHPEMPTGVEKDILKGMYLFQETKKRTKKKVQLLGSGTILREVIAAADILKNDFGVEADIWSCPSFNELRRDGQDVDRWNMLHPGKKQKVSHVSSCLDGRDGPVVAATDYIKNYADQIRPWVKGRYTVLGTDGFGRSDGRVPLRHHFEVDRYFVALAALRGLADDGVIPMADVTKAIKKLKIDPEKANPRTA